MTIEIIKKQIKLKELENLAQKQFGDLIKMVVDIEKEIIAMGGELHADEEVALMTEQGSKRENIWGINFYPKKSKEEWIEFDSMINIKPSFGNRSRNVENSEIREKIKKIIEKLVIE
jgi:thymidylate synthase